MNNIVGHKDPIPKRPPPIFQKLKIQYLHIKLIALCFTICINCLNLIPLFYRKLLMKQIVMVMEKSTEKNSSESWKRLVYIREYSFIFCHVIWDIFFWQVPFIKIQGVYLVGPKYVHPGKWCYLSSICKSSKQN